jgi:hypothetical protein
MKHSTEEARAEIERLNEECTCYVAQIRHDQEEIERLKAELASRDETINEFQRQYLDCENQLTEARSNPPRPVALIMTIGGNFVHGFESLDDARLFELANGAARVWDIKRWIWHPASKKEE